MILCQETEIVNRKLNKNKKKFGSRNIKIGAL